MTLVASSKATVEVWLTEDEGPPLHDGRAVEYLITIRNGKPQSYQRTLYEDGEVEDVDSGPPEGVPLYVRDEVENHMVPRGAWPQ